MALTGAAALAFAALVAAITAFAWSALRPPTSEQTARALALQQVGPSGSFSVLFSRYEVSLAGQAFDSRGHMVYSETPVLTGIPVRQRFVPGQYWVVELQTVAEERGDGVATVVIDARQGKVVSRSGATFGCTPCIPPIPSPAPGG